MYEKHGLSGMAYLRIFEELWNSQSGKCSRCGIDFVSIDNLYGPKPVMDHCHETGRVRALLCQKCNVLVGIEDKKAKTNEFL